MLRRLRSVLIPELPELPELLQLPEAMMRLRPAFARPLAPVGRRLLVGLVLGLALAGCGGLEPVAVPEPGTDPTRLFATLRLDQRAITLATTAPYDTLQLVVTPLTLAGEPMADLPTPTFRSSDTTVVQVTPEGLLRAVGPGTGVQIFTEVVAPGNVRHADTAVVDVRNPSTIPRLASLSIQPGPTDSAVVSMADFPSFAPSELGMLFLPRFSQFVGFPPYYSPPTIRAIDSNGDPIPELTVELVALDPTVGPLTGSGGNETATVQKRITIVGAFAYVYPLAPGPARLVARATAYGITLADTAHWQVTWPAWTKIRLVAAPDGTPQFEPAEVRLAPSGLVQWYNYLSDTLDVTFDDPTNVAEPAADICQVYIADAGFRYGGYDPGPHCGAGNVRIPALEGPTYYEAQGEDPNDPAILGHRAVWNDQARQFPVPGIYRFHTSSGATGQITVTANPAGTFP